MGTHDPIMRIQPPLTPLCLDKRGSKPHYVCVCVCVCISLSTLVLHRASGKSFLGQTYHLHKCGHHTVARYGMEGRQTEADTHTNTSICMYYSWAKRAMQTLQNTDTKSQEHNLNMSIGLLIRDVSGFNVKLLIV